MKAYKFISSLLLVALALPVVNSCKSSFLDEELTTKRNTDYFKTNEGVEALTVGLYQYLRFYVCSETGYSYYNYGTDEFTEGADNSNGMWNSYSTGLAPSVAAVNSNTVGANSLWDYMYIGINAANTVLDRIETEVYTGADGKTLAGTAHFLRGFHYFQLVSQYGGVPIKLDPSTTVSFEFERSSAQEVFAQVEKDLLAAYDELPDDGAKVGKITKSAAAHFLAKAYLWRASELNSAWNGSTKDSDLNNVIKYAQYVIDHHPLAKNFKDLWDYSGPDGANESLDEIVLSSQFTSDNSTWNVGGCMYFYSTSQYRDLPGMFRDVPGGREYNRLRTTYYSVYQYDLVSDSRFWKSFRTKMNMCKKNVPDGYVPGEDRGVMYVVNQPGDDRFEGARHDDANHNNLVDAETGRKVGTSFVFFPKGTSYDDLPMEQFINNSGFKYFPMNTKYVDGSRESIGDSHCFRDGIIARSAEDYFFIAEAYIRQGKYPEATAKLNDIRRRAAWKAGEDRGEHVDGGQAWYNSIQAGAEVPGVSSYCDRNSYYESNDIVPGSLDAEASDIQIKGSISNLSDLPKEDQAIARKLGVSGAYDVALCFLLNEKSREMSLELVRWPDLARTKTLISRVKAFNKEGAANIQERHYFRPIPQSYLDVLRRDGHALSADEKQAIQNPGY